MYDTKRVGPAGVWNVHADGGPERPVEGMESFNRIGRLWGVGAQGNYYVLDGATGPGDKIQFFSFATRRPSRWGIGIEELTRSSQGLLLSPDGRQLLTVRRRSEDRRFDRDSEFPLIGNRSHAAQLP
jgi:hypothetical protein